MSFDREWHKLPRPIAARRLIEIRNQLREQLIFESYAQGLCRTTQDQKEAVKAFMEKREPQFKGL